MKPLGDVDRLLLPAPRRYEQTPGLVLVGASTGGPQALVTLVTGLASMIAVVPVCVTLHMPPDFVPVIAAHVARVCRVETCVVANRRPLLPGMIYFAPGDRTIEIRRLGLACEITLAARPARDICVPAVDAMFASGAKSHGGRALGIVLSGMGRDGLAGARAIVAAGGTVLVQDKVSSAVWGMPGAIARADLAAAILDPEDLARDVVRRLRRVGGA